MKAKPIIIGVAAVALVAIFINDLVNQDAHALERVSARLDLSVNCKILNQDGGRWGVCRYKNGAPASVWLAKGDAWIAANGNAIEVVDRLSKFEYPDDNLPNVQRDYTSPPTMPADLLER